MSAKIQDEIFGMAEVPRDMDGYGNINNHRPPWWAIPVLSFFLMLLLTVLVWLGSTVLDLKISVATGLEQADGFD